MFKRNTQFHPSACIYLSQGAFINIVFWSVFPPGDTSGFQSLEILAVCSVLYVNRSDYMYLYLLSGYFYRTMQGDYHWDDNITVKNNYLLRIDI